MVTEAISGKAAPVVPIVTGVATGLITFAGLCVWFGLPIVPTTDKLPTIFRDVPSPYGALVDSPAGPTDPAEQAYVAACGACHQATGEGLAGAFPPLAGSEWVTGDAETPIRIVLAGLSGPISVKGQTFNSMMPPPPGLDDAKIAQILTYARSHFGNKASVIDTAQVAAVRASLAGRSTPWTADELTALRKGPGDSAPAGAAPAGTTAEGAAPAAPATPVPPAGTPAPPTNTTPTGAVVGAAEPATAGPGSAKSGNAGPGAQGSPTAPGGKQAGSTP
jgi:mono/diheme cytochrome c family protein